MVPGLTWIAGDSKSAFDRIDAALAKVPAAKSIRLGFRAHFYIQYAWEARGSAFGGQVAEDAWRRFAERAVVAREAAPRRRGPSTRTTGGCRPR